MLAFTNRFLRFWISLDAFKDGANAFIQDRGESERADEVWRRDLSGKLVELKNDREALEMTAIVARIDHFLIILMAPILFTVIRSEITAILAGLAADMTDIKFVAVPKKGHPFFENDNLFGPQVEGSFPLLADDIKNAGNCMALDLHAGAMYYLMCVVNKGLIALAHHLRVRIKNRPLEYAEWQDMITKIEGKLNQKTLTLKGNRKTVSNKRALYSGWLVEIKFFKELRNDVMHARSNFNGRQVENAFIRVRDFMHNLAGGITA